MWDTAMYIHPHQPLFPVQHPVIIQGLLVSYVHLYDDPDTFGS